jgi:hypothetical protein
MCWPSLKQKDNFEDLEKKAEGGRAIPQVRVTNHYKIEGPEVV